jgi:glutamate--cysteine ligase
MIQNKNTMNLVEEINNLIFKNRKKIDDWLYHKELKNMPIYSSVDIRNSGFKISPVDTNLFPSGFNNISDKSSKIATSQFTKFFKKEFPSAKKIAVIMENYTKNIHYWEHAKVLLNILENCGLDVRLVVLQSALIPVINNIDLGVEVFKAEKRNDSLIIDKDWSPDVILLNNDLTAKVPEEINGIKNPILPNLKYGWHGRKKNHHNETYNNLLEQFCTEFKIDPWLLSTYSAKCDNIRFKRKEGLSHIAENVNNIIVKIQQKYDEYQIKDIPYVFIKADRGTFGLGIFAVKEGAEVLNINKKLRHSLDTIKYMVVNSEVIIQEGISTIERFQDYPAENVIYLVNGSVVGNFIRYNVNKGIDNNLNSKGMFFAKTTILPTLSEMLISRLASIAVSYEKI